MAYFDTKKIEDYRKIDVVTSKRHPGMKTKFSQNEFGEILHEIDLPVILIAYQRKALDNISKNGSNSFSDAVDDVAEQIRYGYISGFDIHRPDVEGMVRNNLHSASGSMQLYVGMLIASDCHEWSAYPKHDIRSRDRLPIEFSHIKALPTFKGLLMALTSPATRFARFVNTPQSVIKSFTYKLGSTERKINLSPGINVIVGENGSGKSTLLDFLADEKLEDYENKIVRSNELKRQGYPRNKEYVRQAELIQQYHSGKLTSHGIYEDAYPVIDTSDFEQRLNRYIRALIDTMDKRLKANAQLEAENRDIVFQQDRDTFFVDIEADVLNVIDSTQDSDRDTALSDIIEKLDSEFQNSYYNDVEKENIHDAITSLRIVADAVHNRKLDKQNIAAVQNQITASVKRYGLKLESLKTTSDKETQKYREAIKILEKSVLSRVKAQCDIAKEIPIFPSFNSIAKKCSKSKDCGGFVFHSSAAFIDELDSLENSLCQKLFNKGHDIHTFSDLSKIKTEEDWVSSVKGATSDDSVEPSLMTSLDRFVAQKAEIKYEIQKQGIGKVSRGSTLGEQALVYYQVLTDRPEESDTVFFFDQPEDNISNRKIMEDLNAAIGKLRDKHQVIFVTHNPLMVVNLDADNVIFLESTHRFGTQSTLKMSISNGCLEDEENQILEKIANQMDGGEDAVETRLKRYGR